MILQSVLQSETQNHRYRSHPSIWVVMVSACLILTTIIASAPLMARAAPGALAVQAADCGQAQFSSGTKINIVAPASNVPQEFAQFSGKWTGIWSQEPNGNTICHILAIETIDALGRVKGVYQRSGVRPRRFKSHFIDGKFAFPSFQVMLSAETDGRISLLEQSKSGTPSEFTMQRVDSSVVVPTSTAASDANATSPIAASASSSPSYPIQNLEFLANTAGAYKAWADACNDPAGVTAKTDFLSMVDGLALGEKTVLIQRFEKRYAQRKDYAEQQTTQCIAIGKTDCCDSTQRGRFNDAKRRYQNSLDGTIAAAISADPGSNTAILEDRAAGVSTPIVIRTPPPSSPAPGTPANTQTAAANSENQTPRISKLKAEDFDGIEWNPQILLISTLVGIDVHLERCLGFREPIRANVETYSQATKPPQHQGVMGGYDNRYNKLERLGLLNRYTQLGGDWHYRSDDCTDEAMDDLYFAYEKWEQGLLGIASPVAVEYQTPKIATLTIEEFAGTTLNENTYNPVTLESIIQIDLHIEHCLKFREPIKANYDVYLETLGVDYWEDRSFQYENTHTNFGRQIAVSSYTVVYPSSYKRSDCRTEVIADLYSEYEKWEKGLLDGTRSW